MRTNPKGNIPKKITQLRDEYERVVVFTQDENLVLDFLVNQPGRFLVGCNETYWDKPRHNKICDGALMPSFKVGVTQFNKPCDVGLDRDGRDVVFTANPFFNLRRTDAIVKTKFRFPKVKHTPEFKLMDAYELLKPVGILFESKQKLIKVHDWMIINDAKHSLTSEEEATVTLALHNERVSADKHIYFTFNPNVEMLFPHFKNKEIYLSDISFKHISYPVIKNIFQIFNEFQDCGITKEFISFRLSAHPSTITNTLEFLILSGCVKRAMSDKEVVTIHKKYIESPDDMLRMIPEGSWQVKQLMKHLKLQRESVFQVLKKYEGKGLNFSYVPKNDDEIFVAVKDLDNDAYSKTNEYLKLNSFFMNDLIESGENHINKWLESKIEKHCLATGTKAVLFADGQETTLNFTSTDSSRSQPVLDLLR